MAFKGYMAGVNLGGWISQYSQFDRNHFESFIQKDDIERIASWGMDHVRLPVDYPVIEDEDQPKSYRQEGFSYLERCYEWCHQHDLNLVIDLHRAPGYSFGTPQDNLLLSDEALQDRFLSLWREIARRFRHLPETTVVYELLNEIVEPDSTDWNQMAIRAIEAIREVDNRHKIIVGGIHYNSVNALKDLPIFSDPKVVYTFHMYEPFALTHQKASWSPEAMQYGRAMHYPSQDVKGYVDFESIRNESIEPYQGLERVDSRFIERFLKPALDFLKSHDRLLYCGEYGVIDHADLKSREAWTSDVADFCLQHGIGRAIWSYKKMNFTLIDAENKPLSKPLIEAASRH